MITARTDRIKPARPLKRAGRANSFNSGDEIEFFPAVHGYIGQCLTVNASDYEN